VAARWSRRTPGFGLDPAKVDVLLPAFILIIICCPVTKPAEPPVGQIDVNLVARSDRMPKQ
jgi:hypothetical protein